MMKYFKWVSIWTNAHLPKFFTGRTFWYQSANRSDVAVSVVIWWRHQMETFSALLAFSAGNSPVTGEFPSQRPVTRSFDVLFDVCLNKRLSKQSWGWWFETLSRPLWRHCNEFRAGPAKALMSSRGMPELYCIYFLHCYCPFSLKYNQAVVQLRYVIRYGLFSICCGHIPW